MRGEDASVRAPSEEMSGSPPHARGRRRLRERARRGRRITPACAGKTDTEGYRRYGDRDHPRMRGEDTEYIGEYWLRYGSPPHARGRPDGVLGLRTSQDHPRMRGEDCERRFKLRLDVGSPPHARGRRRVVVHVVHAHGITPACAGKTLLVDIRATVDKDHPRMRGEDEIVYARVVIHVGSPPHARGRRENARSVGQRAGITPACAGKTTKWSQTRSSRGDHPRMRGEDAIGYTPTAYLAGSPPHARGRPSPHPTVVFACRDHPRMRGEDRSLYRSTVL